MIAKGVARAILSEGKARVFEKGRSHDCQLEVYQKQA